MTSVQESRIQPMPSRTCAIWAGRSEAAPACARTIVRKTVRARPEGRWSAAGDSAAYASKTASSPVGSRCGWVTGASSASPPAGCDASGKGQARCHVEQLGVGAHEDAGLAATGGVEDDPRGLLGGHPQGLGGDGQGRLGVALGGAPERRPLVATGCLMPPGCTVVTPMPSSSRSPAIDSEKPRRPNLFVQ